MLTTVGMAEREEKKEKVISPGYVLKAQTVLVAVILPDAGKTTDDPLANQKAQADVENAFMKWGGSDWYRISEPGGPCDRSKKRNGKECESDDQRWAGGLAGGNRIRRTTRYAL